MHLKDAHSASFCFVILSDIVGYNSCMKIFSTIHRIIFSRISVCAVGIIFQLTYLLALFWMLGTMFSYSYFVFLLLGIAAALYIINRELSPGYKLIWVFVVLSFPVFGCMFYWFYGKRGGKGQGLLHKEYTDFMCDDENIADDLLASDESAAKQARYIRRSGMLKIYPSADTSYFSCGEQLFPSLLAELEKAERFIFIEFFIIDNGLVWDSIRSILERKSRQGVDVRIIYDDLGCLMNLPRNYADSMRKRGLKCVVFSRLKPYWSSKLNNRDHRKIIVIDGKTAFTGGINLADEYINAYEKHGYWKDSAVLIKGRAVEAFTAMFLGMWNTINSCFPDEDEMIFFPDIRTQKSDGLVIPYASYPSDDSMLAENIYINILNSASRYVYITTPYLILDSEMQEALTLAAKNGIDVRIITPYIPDKRAVHAVTRSNYRVLLKSGVRIYEFLPGFIHAKNFVSDDKIAVVGTVNLDFRSLYLHYECGVWMYGTTAVNDIRDDFLHTLEHCKEISVDDTYEKNFFKRLLWSIVRIFSPLM